VAAFGAFWYKIASLLRVVKRMSVDSRRIENVFAVMEGLASSGDGLMRVGEVADALREGNAPIPVWQLRADCAALAQAGRLQLHAQSGAWVVVAEQSAKGVA
jgi:hypothetical protein